MLNHIYFNKNNINKTISEIFPQKILFFGFTMKSKTNFRYHLTIKGEDKNSKHMFQIK